LGKVKEDLGDRIDDLKITMVELKSQSDLNKERIDRIQDINNIRFANLEDNNKQTDKRIGQLRAEIDRRLTLRKENPK
jgi:chaperonin cofactor prefoldin